MKEGDLQEFVFRLILMHHSHLMRIGGRYIQRIQYEGIDMCITCGCLEHRELECPSIEHKETQKVNKGKEHMEEDETLEQDKIGP